MGVAERVSQLVEPIATRLGYEIVRVRFKGHVLQIMAERPDGTMNIDDCATLSRALSPVLDEADPISEGYSLEVSSPGIDRPLTRSKDFVNWAGHEAKVELAHPLNKQKRFRGMLKGINDDAVLLEIQGTDGPAAVELPLSAISEAKLVLTDELLRQAAANQNQIDESEFDKVEIDEAVGSRE
ncbi:MAG TPA: ribosome maturation factor RimP [Alphaproteobacteria bacterium]|nr:ribosome maturation factor RimP [Alphaproteobacteria bacterium]